MTPEEIQELKDLIILYKKADIFSGVLCCIAICVGIALWIWELYKYKQVKKMHQEWKSLLNEDEIKVLNRHKEYIK